METPASWATSRRVAATDHPSSRRSASYNVAKRVGPTSCNVVDSRFILPGKARHDHMPSPRKEALRMLRRTVPRVLVVLLAATFAGGATPMAQASTGARPGTV